MQVFDERSLEHLVLVELEAAQTWDGLTWLDWAAAVCGLVRRGERLCAWKVGSGVSGVFAFNGSARTHDGVAQTSFYGFSLVLPGLREPSGRQGRRELERCCTCRFEAEPSWGPSQMLFPCPCTRCGQCR